MERRLAAIVAADIAAFSRMMSRDEVGTYLRLSERFSQVFVPTINEFNGRIVKTLGDGFLAEFPSAVDAVLSAEALQERNRKADEVLDGQQRMKLRIGVSLGDIIVSEQDVFGNGVNIAARLQGMAGTDGICVTAAVAEQVKNRTKRSIRSRGFQRLHNFDEEIPVFDLVVGNGSDVEVHPSWSKLPHPTKTKRPSIAVLPLDDLRGGESDNIFSDGVTEDIITELSRFRSLSVIARNSSFRYRGGQADISRIRRELGVEYILEGSIQRSAREIRLTVQLIDCETQAHLWANRFDFQENSIFSVRDEVTRAIVSCISQHLDHSIVAHSKARNPTELQAYELYLRGADVHERRGLAGYPDAKRYYSEAILADPSYCRPHAGLAEILYVESIYKPRVLRDKATELALVHARRAVELDEQEAHGHAVLGFVSLYARQFLRADRAFVKAVELNPSDADIAMLRASELAHVGKSADAIDAAKSALANNPFVPDWYFSELSLIYYLCGRLDESVAYAELTEDVFPHSSAWLALALFELGESDRARTVSDRLVESMRGVWRSDQSWDPREFGKWLVEFAPIAPKELQMRLLQGLQGLGLLAVG